MLESVTLQIFFGSGLKMPGRSALTELTNALGNETRKLVRGTACAGSAPG
ncbi:MAG TPA: hypothetical protein VMK12_30050 [Anaeromyxobacteraceae bacterium]|nr:hypothetical protein [Anaeromyxobacteraceae bacterium]